MNATTFTEPILSLYRCLDEIAGNIAYIGRELPALEMDDGVRAAITRMCNDFDSALFELNSLRADDLHTCLRTRRAVDP